MLNKNLERRSTEYIKRIKKRIDKKKTREMYIKILLLFEDKVPLILEREEISNYIDCVIERKSIIEDLFSFLLEKNNIKDDFFYPLMNIKQTSSPDILKPIVLKNPFENFNVLFLKKNFNLKLNNESLKIFTEKINQVFSSYFQSFMSNNRTEFLSFLEKNKKEWEQICFIKTTDNFFLVTFYGILFIIEDFDLSELNEDYKFYEDQLNESFVEILNLVTDIFLDLLKDEDFCKDMETKKKQTKDKFDKLILENKEKIHYNKNMHRNSFDLSSFFFNNTIDIITFNRLRNKADEEILQQTIENYKDMIKNNDLKNILGIYNFSDKQNVEKSKKKETIITYLFSFLFRKEEPIEKSDNLEEKFLNDFFKKKESEEIKLLNEIFFFEDLENFNFKNSVNIDFDFKNKFKVDNHTMEIIGIGKKISKSEDKSFKLLLNTTDYNLSFTILLENKKEKFTIELDNTTMDNFLKKINNVFNFYFNKIMSDEKNSFSNFIRLYNKDCPDYFFLKIIENFLFVSYFGISSIKKDYNSGEIPSGFNKEIRDSFLKILGLVENCFLDFLKNYESFFYDLEKKKKEAKIEYETLISREKERIKQELTNNKPQKKKKKKNKKSTLIVSLPKTDIEEIKNLDKRTTYEKTSTEENQEKIENLEENTIVDKEKKENDSSEENTFKETNIKKNDEMDSVIFQKKIIEIVFGEEVKYEKTDDEKTLEKSMTESFLETDREKESNLNENETVLNGNQKTLNENEKTLNRNEETLKKNEETLNENEKTLNENEKTLNRNEETLNRNEETLNRNETVLNGNEKTLKKNKTVLNENEKVLNENEETLKKNEETLKKNEETLKKNEETLKKNEETSNRNETVLNKKKKGTNLSFNSEEQGILNNENIQKHLKRKVYLYFFLCVFNIFFFFFITLIPFFFNVLICFFLVNLFLLLKNLFYLYRKKSL